ncbi:MAG TPA: hypothetical protein VHL11_18275, partial [Phototrophicaceae bacterium]|nr:hypothetical protein [Phototrophicaceae bacterium]
MFKRGLRSMMFSLSALMLIVIVTGTGRVSAQNSAWTAWLYSAAIGNILQVNQAGTVIGDFTLPLAQGFNGYGRWAVVSSGGRYIAYTEFDSTQQSPSEQLFIYDQVIGAIRFTYDMTGAQASGFEFSRSAMAFDEGAGRFAFGYLTETGGWQVVVGDFATSSALAVLNAGSAPSLQLPGNIVPVVQRLDGQSVMFTAVAYGTNFLPAYPAFRWDFTSGDVTPDDRYTTIVIDSDLATGQVAAAGFDANQP